MRNLTDNEKEKTGFLLNEFFENRIDNALEETLKRSKRFQEISKKLVKKQLT